MVNWKGLGKGDRGLIRVLFWNFTAETEENI
jgi:hypothetical protein